MKILLPNFKAVHPIEAELRFLKVKKLDACIRLPFANSVTYTYIHTYTFIASHILKLARCIISYVATYNTFLRNFIAHKKFLTTKYVFPDYGILLAMHMCNNKLHVYKLCSCSLPKYPVVYSTCGND